MTLPAEDSDSDMTVRSEPPSPCLWAVPASGALAVAEESIEQEDSHPDDERELELSPASQLNVLSQISAMGELEMRKTAVVSSRTVPVRSHIWAPSGTGSRNSSNKYIEKKTPVRRTKQAIASEREHKAASPRPALKRRRVMTNPLAEDMLDWESCSEGEMMFAGLESSTQEDEWRYEDLSDSDFDSNI